MYWTTLLGRQKRAAEHLSSTLSLYSRFLINIPDEDKDDAMRVCGQVSPKQWSSVTLAPSIALSRYSLDKRAVMKAYNSHAT